MMPPNSIGDMKKVRFSIGLEMQDYFLVGSSQGFRIAPACGEGICIDFTPQNGGVLPIIPAVFVPHIYLMFSPIKNLGIKLSHGIIFIIPEEDIFYYRPNLEIAISYLIKFLEPSAGLIYLYNDFTDPYYWGIKVAVNFLFLKNRRADLLAGVGSTIILDSSFHAAFGVHLNLFNLRFKF
jgi:hypothetical protein